MTTATLTASMTLTARLVPPSSVWHSLYSDEWTSDRLPRQVSEDIKREGLKDYGAKVGLPDYYRVYTDPRVVMKETQQYWLAEVLGLAWIGIPYTRMTNIQKKGFLVEWAEFLAHGRCFTNFTAWDNGLADYIQGKNIGADPMEWEVLVLGGNKVDVLDETLVSFPEKYLGVQASYRHLLVRAVDSDILPSPEKFLQDPYVCHIPTTIQPGGGKWVFPQFDEKACYPLWAPRGVVHIWERLISKV